MSDLLLQGGCGAFRQKFNVDFNCCDSCHDDEEMGYDMCEHYDGDDFWIVCCAAVNARCDYDPEVSVEETPQPEREALR